MGKFKKESIKSENLPISDTGIFVSELIELIRNNESYHEVVRFLGIDEIINDFISIKGALTLVSKIKSANSKYKKFDLESEINDITLFSESKFSINFNKLDRHEYFQEKDVESLSAIPIYSASRDFFSDLYQMDRYASNLISNGHKEILNENLKLLKEVTNKTRKYRILHDFEEDKYYLRGIISTSKYYNYDNNMALVIALVTLHKEMNTSNTVYKLALCEYNESSIRMFFESSEIKELENIGRVKNIVEVSNDEIKREALKFLCVCSIVFKRNNRTEEEIYLKPQDVKSKILSVKHNQTPKTAMKELLHMANAQMIHNELFTDISRIKDITTPDQIRFLLMNTVSKARRNELKQFKDEILSVLDTQVNTIIQLLTIFKKINLIATADIEVEEYLRYLMYEILIDRKAG